MDFADSAISTEQPLMKSVKMLDWTFVLVAVKLIDSPATSEDLLKVTTPLPLNIFMLVQL